MLATGYTRDVSAFNLMAPAFRWNTAQNGTARRPISITTAANSLDDQYRVRVRRCAIVSSLQLFAFLLAGVVYGFVGIGWVSLAILGLALPAPWAVAHVIDDLPPWEGVTHVARGELTQIGRVSD